MLRFFRQIRQKLLVENRFNKYLLYVVIEVFIVIIGILIAIQVDNWNTRRLDQERMEKYARALTLDLKNDIKMVRSSLFQAKRNYRKIDSLKIYFSNTKTEELSNTDLFILSHTITYRPFEWNRSTLDEIKASGSLRDIKNDSLKKKIIEYEAFTHHLDEDFKFDRVLAQRANELMSEILFLNIPYFTEFLKLERIRYNDPELDLFNTAVYEVSKANDHFLNSYDEQLLNTFLNAYIQIQQRYYIRAYEEMPEIISDANEIIGILELEYQLE
jgi:hypothetical protein